MPAITFEQAERIIELLSSIDKKLASDAIKSPYTMGAKEAARYLNIGYDTLLRKIRSGENIPSANTGKKLIFRSDSLDTWMKNREIKPVEKEEPFKVEPPAYGVMKRIR